jgi:demethylmenaquinone methyltransferase/2-methoxy-6-polyprenyl-1,4-benzoquinol methylase
LIKLKGKDKEAHVQSVFAAIARRYDLLNTVLSFNQDRYWRRFAIRQTGLQPGGNALDVCCGTGMMVLAEAEIVGPEGHVTGLDFSRPMLAVAAEHIAKTNYAERIKLIEGNAMDLPFPDNTFDCATIAFGLRNVPDILQTLREMQRVVRPDGRVVCLELAKPSAPVFKQLYYFYFEHLLPLLGKLGIGREGPYRWLPESLKLYPHQTEIRDLFEKAGLKNAHFFELTGGITSVHVGTK